MIGMGVPPVEPLTGAESSIWPAIITGIVFGLLLVGTIWTYVHRRHTAESEAHEEEIPLLKAA